MMTWVKKSFEGTKPGSGRHWLWLCSPPVITGGWMTGPGGKHWRSTQHFDWHIHMSPCVIYCCLRAAILHLMRTLKFSLKYEMWKVPVTSMSLSPFPVGWSCLQHVLKLNRNYLLTHQTMKSLGTGTGYVLSFLVSDLSRHKWMLLKWEKIPKARIDHSRAKKAIHYIAFFQECYICLIRGVLHNDAHLERNCKFQSNPQPSKSMWKCRL